MKLSWRELLAGATLLCAVAAQNSSSGGLSSSDLLTILAKLPTCVTTCSLSVLSAANCEVVDIRSCLCTNDTMQAVLAICVLDSCNITEQAIATTVAQKDICEGIPQPSRSSEIIQCVVVISIITFPIIILRLLSRCLISHSLWWDDWLVFLCSLLLVPMAVFPILNATKGFGKHFYTIPPGNIPLLREIYYVSQIFYAIVHPVAKISMLLLYLRIFPDITFQRATKISIVWMIIHLVAFFFAVTFQCVPVRSIWDTSIPGRCTNLVAVIYSGAILSIVEDVIIILLPITQLRGLKTTLRKKLALIFMFSLGSFACITSMIRLKYIVQFNSDVDLTWADVDMTIWSIIEVYSAVICVCLLSIRPLLVQYFPKLFPGSQPSSKSSRPPWDPSPRLNSRLTGKEQNSSRGATLLSGDETPRDTEMNMSKNSMIDTEDNIELTPTRPPSFMK